MRVSSVVVLFFCFFAYSICFFFFSSRRRHTRFDCDWSSDVCSSDLSSRAFNSRSNASLTATLSLPEHDFPVRSEEHTSELQSQSNLVCRLLLEKKKKKKKKLY